MTPTLATDFATLLARIGAWPSDIDPSVSRALYVAASTGLHGGCALDVAPHCGKSTIILAAAAHLTDSKVSFMIQNVNQMEQMWFGRAMTLFKMTRIVTQARDVKDLDVQFALVRNQPQLIESVYTDILRPGGILFTLGTTEIPGMAVEAKGPNFTIYRKPMVVAAPVPDHANGHDREKEEREQVEDDKIEEQEAPIAQQKEIFP